jgi:hypothetical protein
MSDVRCVSSARVCVYVYTVMNGGIRDLLVSAKNSVSCSVYKLAVSLRLHVIALARPEVWHGEHGVDGQGPVYVFCAGVLTIVACARCVMV